MKTVLGPSWPKRSDIRLVFIKSDPPGNTAARPLLCSPGPRQLLLHEVGLLLPQPLLVTARLVGHLQEQEEQGEEKDKEQEEQDDEEELETCPEPSDENTSLTLWENSSPASESRTLNMSLEELILALWLELGTRSLARTWHQLSGLHLAPALRSPLSTHSRAITVSISQPALLFELPR